MHWGNEAHTLFVSFAYLAVVIIYPDYLVKYWALLPVYWTDSQCWLVNTNRLKPVNIQTLLGLLFIYIAFCNQNVKPVIPNSII